MDKKLTTKELAEVLRTSEATIRRWARQKKVPYIRGPGGRYIFDFEEINSFLETRKVKAAELNNEEILLKGAAASPGIARGRVKVMIFPDETGKMEDGCILVAPFTTPAYTSAMLKAAAIVTDIGGVLSHAAIVCREFGIPCVVSTGAATKKLKDNMEITVNGDEGTVYK